MITSGAALMLWGHYWDAESGMTVVSLVAKPKYRGVASGIGYNIVKITAFLTTLVFPPLLDALGAYRHCAVPGLSCRDVPASRSFRPCRRRQ